MSRYGCIRSVKDERDYKFVIPEKPRLMLGVPEKPSKFDLRNMYELPEIYNQGNIGSCTAQGVSFCYYFNEIKQGTKSQFQPSRLFIYYNSRKIEGTINQDSGCQIRDVLKSVNTDGVCQEAYCEYNTSNYQNEPPKEAYDEAVNCKTTVYKAVDQNVDSLKAALLDGFPIVFGFEVYSSFKTTCTRLSGNMKTPDPTKETLEGGHCVCIVGYDDSKSAFICRNSWGFCWGNGGYFYMPYSVATDPKLAYDFWIIEGVTDPELNLVPIKWTTKLCNKLKRFNPFSKSY